MEEPVAGFEDLRIECFAIDESQRFQKQSGGRVGFGCSGTFPMVEQAFSGAAFRDSEVCHATANISANRRRIGSSSSAIRIVAVSVSGIIKGFPKGLPAK